MDKKSPFAGYSTEQVASFESMTYFLQVGSDIFNIRGKCFFNKKSANIYYGKVMRQLLGDMKHGNEEEKKNAERVMLGMRVVPLKLQ